MPVVVAMVAPVMVVAMTDLSGGGLSGGRGFVMTIAFGFRVSGGYDKSDKQCQ